MRIMIVLYLLLIAIISPCYAAQQQIITSGDYAMGEGETILSAKERALNVAKQNAVEQAGIYIESLSQVQNFKLTKDEINTIAAGTIEIKDKKYTKKFSDDGNGIIFNVIITCNVDTDNIETLRNKAQEKAVIEDYKKMQGDYSRIQTEVEVLKKELVAAKTDQEKKAISEKLLKNENEFTAVDWFQKGREYNRLSKPNEAAAAYTKAIQLNPSYASAYYNRSILYKNSGYYDLAIADLDIASKISPDDSDIHYNRGFYCDMAGRFNDASYSYHQFLRTEQKDAYRIAYAKRRIAIIG